MKTIYFSFVLTVLLSATCLGFLWFAPSNEPGRVMVGTVTSCCTLFAIVCSSICMFWFHRKHFPSYMHLKGISVFCIFASIWLASFLWNQYDQKQPVGIGTAIAFFVGMLGLSFLHIPFFKAPKLHIE